MRRSRSAPVIGLRLHDVEPLDHGRRPHGLPSDLLQHPAGRRRYRHAPNDHLSVLQPRLLMDRVRALDPGPLTRRRVGAVAHLARRGGAKISLDTANLGTGLYTQTDASYEGTFMPVAVGGYFWLVFVSERVYGNTLTSIVEGGLVSARASQAALGHQAIDAQPTAGKDPSHPAFWLAGQDLDHQNMRGEWALDPCKAHRPGVPGRLRDAARATARPGDERDGVRQPDRRLFGDRQRLARPTSDCCSSSATCIERLLQRAARRSSRPGPWTPPLPIERRTLLDPRGGRSARRVRGRRHRLHPDGGRPCARSPTVARCPLWHLGRRHQRLRPRGAHAKARPTAARRPRPRVARSAARGHRPPANTGEARPCPSATSSGAAQRPRVWPGASPRRLPRPKGHRGDRAAGRSRSRRSARTSRSGQPPRVDHLDDAPRERQDGRLRPARPGGDDGTVEPRPDHRTMCMPPGSRKSTCSRPAALPLMFPAVEIDGEFYLRRRSPAERPATRLRAGSVPSGLIVINPRFVAPCSERGTTAPTRLRRRARSSSLGRHSTPLLLDRIDNDLDRLQRINAILDAGTRRFGTPPSSTRRQRRNRQRAARRPKVRSLKVDCTSARRRTSGCLAATYVRSAQFHRRAPVGHREAPARRIGEWDGERRSGPPPRTCSSTAMFAAELHRPRKAGRTGAPRRAVRCSSRATRDREGGLRLLGERRRASLLGRSRVVAREDDGEHDERRPERSQVSRLIAAPPYLSKRMLDTGGPTSIPTA